MSLAGEYTDNTIVKLKIQQIMKYPALYMNKLERYMEDAQ